MTHGVAEDIRDYIQTTCSFDTDECFVGNLYPDPDNQIAVATYGGPPPIMAMGPQNIVERIQRVQILVRNTSYADATDNMEAIYGALAGAIDITIGSNVYDKISVLNEPMALMDDNNARTVLVLNIETWKRGL